MINMCCHTGLLADDNLEHFVISIFDGIKLADSLGANYSLKISREDVRKLTEAIWLVSNVEVS